MTIGGFLLRVLGAFLLAGLALGIVMPVLYARGIGTSPWIAVAAVVFSLAVFFVPGWARNRRERRRSTVLR